MNSINYKWVHDLYPKLRWVRDAKINKIWCRYQRAAHLIEETGLWYIIIIMYKFKSRSISWYKRRMNNIDSGIYRLFLRRDLKSVSQWQGKIPTWSKTVFMNRSAQAKIRMYITAPFLFILDIISFSFFFFFYNLW